MSPIALILTPTAIDLIIVVAILTYIIIAVFQGSILSFLQLLTYIASAFIGFTLAPIITATISIFSPFSNQTTFALIFVLIILVSQIIFHFFLSTFFDNLHHYLEPYAQNPAYKIISIANHLLGILPGFLEGLFFSAFVVSAIFLFSSSRLIKFNILDSKYGNPLILHALNFEAKSHLSLLPSPYQSPRMAQLLGSLQQEKIVRLPQTDTVAIHDSTTQQAALYDLNKLRQSNSLASVITSSDVDLEAQTHADDILLRGYISTFDNAGQNLEARLQAKSINADAAEERIIFVPAKQDLILNSQEATDSAELKAVKDNFLSGNYKEFGIGVSHGLHHGDKIYDFIFTASETSN